MIFLGSNKKQINHFKFKKNSAKIISSTYMTKRRRGNTTNFRTGFENIIYVVFAKKNLKKVFWDML